MVLRVGMGTSSRKQSNTNVSVQDYHMQSSHFAPGKDIYATVGKVLYSKGFVYSPDPESPAERLGFKADYEAITAGSGQGECKESEDVRAAEYFSVYDAWGSNSRGRASRLRALGWKKEEKEDVLAAIESEVEYICSEGRKH